MEKNNEQRKSYKIAIIVISTVAFLCIELALFYALGGFDKFFNQTASKNEAIVETSIEDEVSNNGMEKQKELKVQDVEYKKKLGYVLGDMELNASMLTSDCSLISKYWHNGIFSNKGIDDSINEALAKLDEIYKEVGSDNIDKDKARREIKATMQELSNPPEEFKEVYDLTVEIYGYYLELYDLSTSPKGTYNTYINSVETASSQIQKNIEKILVIDPSMNVGIWTDKGWEHINNRK